MMHNSQKEALQKCVRRLEECVPYLPIGLRTFVFENIREAQKTIEVQQKPRNVDRFVSPSEASIAYTKECPKDWRGERIYGYVEWLFAEAKGADDAR